MPSAEAGCKAILVNGGGSPFGNYIVHDRQMKEMVQALMKQGCTEKDIFLFSASGSTTAKDFRVDPVDPKSQYVSSPYNYINEMPLENLFPADLKSLKTKIPEITKKFSADDKVFVYLNDHGNKMNGTTGLVPWNYNGDDQLFTAKDLENAFSNTNAKVKVWADCCYCGIFNQAKLKNGCVATSTDSFHVGSYFWTNWNEYIKAGANNGIIKPTIKAPFAGQLKADPKSSLSLAARISNLKLNDRPFVEADLISRGCFIGPRDTSEDYIFEQLGFKNKQICKEDLVKLLKSQNDSNIYVSCESDKTIQEFNQFDEILNALKTNHFFSSPYAKNKIQSIIDKINFDLSTLKNSEEYQEILKLDAEFKALNPSLKFKKASEYQNRVINLKEKLLLSTSLYKNLIENQKIILESIFLKTAPAEQTLEFYRRKQCLDEPLF